MIALHTSNDPINFTDALGLCRSTDVTFSYGYSEGATFYTYGYDEDHHEIWPVVDGPEGGLDFRECQDSDASHCRRVMEIGDPGWTDPDNRNRRDDYICSPDDLNNRRDWWDVLLEVDDGPNACPNIVKVPSEWLGYGGLGRGLAYDLMGDHERATEEYLTVLGVGTGENLAAQGSTLASKVFALIGVGATVVDAGCSGAGL